MTVKRIIGERIWHNGGLINWDDAHTHIMSHALHYGSSIIEGMRCYKTSGGPAIFRLQDHVSRLLGGAKMLRMPADFSSDQLAQGCLDVVSANGLEDCYIRLLMFRGYASLGVDPTHCPVETYIGAWAWGVYLGDDSLDRGIHVCISSITREQLGTLTAGFKAGANFLGAQLVKMDALQGGFMEGLITDSLGHVLGGSAENIFIVANGELFTPPLVASVFPGITRDSIIKLSEANGIPVREQMISRTRLYQADEVFLTGSAAEITPVSQVDGFVVGTGKRGSITKLLAEDYVRAAHGSDRFGWLSRVRGASEAVGERSAE